MLGLNAFKMQRYKFNIVLNLKTEYCTKMTKRIYGKIQAYGFQMKGVKKRREESLHFYIKYKLEVETCSRL